MATKAALRPHNCPFSSCGDAFESLTDLHKHLNDIHMKYECNECHQRFAVPEALAKHVKGCAVTLSTIAKTLPVITKQSSIQLIEPMNESTATAWSQLTDQLSAQKGVTIDKLFICKSNGCGKAFISQLSLVNHLKTHTTSDGQDMTTTTTTTSGHTIEMTDTNEETINSNDKLYECTHDGCGQQFTNGYQLQYHRKCHHNVHPSHYKPVINNMCLVYKCLAIECQYKSNNKRLAISHMKGVHQIKAIYECSHSHCCELYLTADELKLHITAQHTIDGQYVCQRAECDQRFDSLAILATHMRSGHPIPMLNANYKCDKCDKVFVNSMALTCHMKCHSTTGGHKPAAIRSTVTVNRQPVQHKSPLSHTNHQYNPNDDSFVCHMDLCGKRFATKPLLINHVNHCHLRRQLQSCDYPNCDQKFLSKIGLNMHKQKVHSLLAVKSGQYKCTEPDCGHAYGSARMLATHTRLLHDPMDQNSSSNGTQYECQWSVCKYTTSTLVALKHHSRDHQKDRPFACQRPGCDYTTRSKDRLVLHGVIHTPGHLYGCDRLECGQRFKTCGELERHRRVHSSVELAFN